jgi:hypothetical protein
MTTLQAAASIPSSNFGAVRKTGVFHSIIAVLFAVKLREFLDNNTTGDKSDAAVTWGM